MFSFARLWVVINPLDDKFKSVKFVTRIIMVVTVSSIFLSGICTKVYLLFSTLQNVLCLVTADSLSVSLVILLFQCVASVAVTFLHVLLVVNLKRSKKASGQSASVGIATYLQLTFLTTEHFLAWVPSGALFVAAQLTSKYPSQAVIWMTTVGEPCCSVVTILFYLIILSRNKK